MNHLELKVTGMSCSHCENAVHSAVGRLTGVANVKADHNNQKVSVDYEMAKATLEEIKGAIEDQGFNVVEVLAQS